QTRGKFLTHFRKPFYNRPTRPIADLEILMPIHVIVWTIAAVATAGVILRPFGWREAIWAVAGAVVLVAPGFSHRMTRSSG
ncbi:hypothetical protein, partial [Streptomyces turgidiscabies]|uniref:hypothetical protein n=1 Tax=Streptomyces turgidiscabies TaxID=85558 RepID=UPI0038F6FF9C